MQVYSDCEEGQPFIEDYGAWRHSLTERDDH